ncbi:hypothetical protein LZ32DRAFT_650252 [Colletotrichum eremochloae]|nr:hypothetical protein LZ32DRAFT_650252 [Colletotrichum eremochloae]
MKSSALTTTGFLLLFTLAQGALGCATYRTCHCYDSDNVPNNNATQIACNGYSKEDTVFSEERSECYYIGPAYKGNGWGWKWRGMDNCDFRKLCATAGATGPDSACTNKLPSNVADPVKPKGW